MQLPMELEQLYSQSGFAWITLYLIFTTTPCPSALFSTAGKKGLYIIWWLFGAGLRLHPCPSLPFLPENIPSLRLWSRQWWDFSWLKQELCEPCRILPLFNKWWCVTWAVSHERAVSAPSLLSWLSAYQIINHFPCTRLVRGLIDGFFITLSSFWQGLSAECVECWSSCQVYWDEISFSPWVLFLRILSKYTDDSESKNCNFIQSALLTLWISQTFLRIFEAFWRSKM